VNVESVPIEAVGEAPSLHPPRLPFVLSVGVTGHRKNAVPKEACDALKERIRTALSLLVQCAAAVQAKEREFYTDEPLRLRFVSPLADGADQIAARVAIDLGFDLHAVLPFAREAYRRELADSEARDAFDELLRAATCVLELPGEHEVPIDAYVMTGRATVAHCDMMLAIWDGLAPRGRGGTGEVVELAVVNGTPVVHVPIEPTQPMRLLWSAFDPTVVTVRVERTTERPLDEFHLGALLTALFAPPADPQERQFLSIFSRERIKAIRARIEYPVMLAITGVAKFNPRRMREAVCAEEIRSEWIRFRQECAEPNEVRAPLDILETAYSWSDQLATHFAQTYRSGHIFNFVFGALAVCMGLLANALNRAPLELALVEAFLTGAIIINTRIGLKNEWHRRWLDYRQLAERLRPMRSLKLLGVAAPDPPGTPSNPVPRRWIEWYANGIWRGLGCPAASIDSRRAADLSRAVATYEIAPQVAYHQRHAHQIELLDERLEKIAGIFFVVTLMVSAAVIVGLEINSAWVNAHDPWFALLEAGLPALGTAIFGIRFQGDFGGSAIRSQATATALGILEAELADGTDLMRAADLTEQAARIMYSDLDEWRLVNEQQELDLGVSVHADRDALRQIFLNLLDNAAKYGPSGQTITVSMQVVKPALVRVAIEDQGPGIPEADRDRVWDPYVRLNRKIESSTGGSGIGLSVVRELIQMHGGRTWMEAGTNGVGTRVVVELPLLRDSRPKPSSMSSRASEASVGT